MSDTGILKQSIMSVEPAQANVDSTMMWCPDVMLLASPNSKLDLVSL